jgi:SulP family sulfate permease
VKGRLAGRVDSGDKSINSPDASMTTSAAVAAPSAAEPGFADLFTPKLVTVLREGYGRAALQRDLAAGLTVAIVALPLSMAIAIASGLQPHQGLVAAIVGGFLVSALGGSRFQIGGPAGAFIVLVSATATRHGLDGLLLATMLSGVMLTAAGYLRLGTYIRLIPYPVTVGFTAGIALIIFASQLKDLFGLTQATPPGHGFVHEVEGAIRSIDSFNPYAAAIAGLVIATIAFLQRWRPSSPAILIAVVLAAAVSAFFDLPVETIGSRFGGVPSGLPAPSFPAISMAKAMAVLPDAFSFALLGAIESLLSATVADGMTGRRHRANCELVAQGFANFVTPIFGGMVVTGTIARTATNIRAGAHGPLSGVFHSLFILLFMLAAAPLASYLPLSALAGVLAVVAFRMIEAPAMLGLIRASKGDAAALLATLLLTVFRDLTIGIVAGVAIGALSFIHRMSQVAGLEPLIERDRADDIESAAPDAGRAASRDGAVGIYRVRGALFFGSAASLAIALDRVIAGRKGLILDFSETTLVDSTGANAIAAFAKQARAQGVALHIAGASREVVESLEAGGVTAAVAPRHKDIEAGLEALR